MASNPADPEATQRGSSAAASTAALPVADHGASTAIGPYQIVGRLGQGGMGTVYEAEQASPRRRVALKVIRGHFADDTQIRMFLREAETLARLEHPNIGAIYESGRTPDGQHYFAMELVRGQTLDAFIATRPALDVDELGFRLRLYVVLCEAVHYAHQRGVIHRDLKPSNVIVGASGSSSGGVRSGSPSPALKILDFGLARLSDAEAATVQSEVGAIKGTLPYMSPEQARGSSADVDVRSDVYALGVMLYELLTGRRPYDTARGSLVEAVRVICDEAPAPLRGVWPGPARLDPDIETIVGKALEKEPGRRYSGAAALSEDVGRYLGSQPILARPPTAAYQLRKFARRNRALVGGAAAVVLVLAVGAVVSTLQAIRATRAEALASSRLDEAMAAQSLAEDRRQEADARHADAERARTTAESRRREAEAATTAANAAREAEAHARAAAETRRLESEASTREAEAARARESTERQRADASAANALDEAAKAQAVNDFLTNDLLASVAPSALAGRGRDVPMREVLDEAARRIEDAARPGGRFATTPLVEASIRLTLGDTYTKLSEFDRATPHIARAVALREQGLGRRHPDTLEALVRQVYLLEQSGHPAEAEPLAREILSSLQASGAADKIAKVSSLLGSLLQDLHRYAEAEKFLRDGVSGLEKALGPDSPEAAGARNNLALLLRATGRDAEALPLFEAVRENQRRTAGPEEIGTLTATQNLANAYATAGRLADAERELAATLPVHRRVFGDTHRMTLGIIVNLADVWVQQGQVVRAESMLSEAFPASRTALGPTHPITLVLQAALARALRLLGRVAEAAQLQEALVETRRAGAGTDDLDTVRARLGLVEIRLVQGRSAEGWEEARVAAKALELALGAAHRDTVSAELTAAKAAIAVGNFDDADRRAADLVSTVPRVFGPSSEMAFEVRLLLGDLRRYQRRQADAERLLNEARAGATAALGPAHQLTLRITNSLAYALIGLGRLPEAESMWTAAYEGWKSLHGAAHPGTAAALYELMRVLGMQKRADRPRAEELLRTIVPLARDPHATPTLLAMAATTLANAPEADRDTTTAVAFARRAVDATGGRHVPLLKLLAQCQLAARDGAGAAATLERALPLVPASSPDREELSRLLDEAKRIKRD